MLNKSLFFFKHIFVVSPSSRAFFFNRMKEMTANNIYRKMISEDSSIRQRLSFPSRQSGIGRHASSKLFINM
jgi:hypothetical protein